MEGISCSNSPASRHSRQLDFGSTERYTVVLVHTRSRNHAGHGLHSTHTVEVINSVIKYGLKWKQNFPTVNKRDKFVTLVPRLLFRAEILKQRWRLKERFDFASAFVLDF